MTFVKHRVCMCAACDWYVVVGESEDVGVGVGVGVDADT